MRGFRSATSSIFVKFSMAFILVGMIPLFALSVFSLRLFTDHVERYTVSNIHQMTLYLSYNIDNAFAQYNEITKLMYTNNVAESATTDQTANVNEYEQINQIPIPDFLSTILHSDPYIRTVYFVRTSDRKLFHATRESAAIMEDRLPIDAWLRPLQEKPNEVAIHLPRRNDYFFKSDKQVMTIGRNLIDISGPVTDRPKVVGTLLFDVDTEAFRGVFRELPLEPNDDVYILDGDDNVYYSNRAEWIGTRRSDGERFDKERLTVTEDLSYLNGKVVLSVSTADLFKQLSATQSGVYLAVAICGCALIAMGIWFSRRLATPIRSVILQMSRVESGNLDARVESVGKDEIGRLARGFNRMVERLRSFIHEAYVAELGRKQAELNALKSQIRPHYLYNTLEVIRMNAVHNDDEEVGDMILSLSNQLKYVIDYGEDWVPIRKELEHLHDYFYIIRVRFEHLIDLRVDIGPDLDLDGIIMPKLSLQPLVENAIQHGIRPKGAKGTVLVRMEIVDETLEISVLDDGAGMTEEALQRVRGSLQGRSSGTGKSVGCRNVHERIKSLCGEAYGLTISSRPHVGTSAKMRLPVRRGGTAG